MEQQSREIIDLASEFQNRLAGDGLPPSFAKLYSQYTRLRENQLGLSGWGGQREVKERLNDVIRLIEASFIKKESGDDESWRKGMRRAGELLEWLSLPKLNPDKLPIRLLSAATYQVSGYPARASGLLRENNIQRTESLILKSLLQSNFSALLDELRKYWATKSTVSSENEHIIDDESSETAIDNYQQLIIDETASALGILCAAMRWGNEPRQPKALKKLFAVSNMLLHSRNSYSWLLAKLCAEVATTYVNSSMRHHLEKLTDTVNETGAKVLENYVRQNYQAGKALVWYSQIQGIERLRTKESFALCTPTGSGKTTIAEIALLQSLFSKQNTSETSNSIAPLVMYLVPSKALATEVEAKLSSVLKRETTIQPVIVTGLYGGIDWSPTDAWLTAEERTVLICTYEKAEALLKFLGIFFLRRVSLVVIDEAHSVQFNGNKESLQKSENRQLRLESLATRLFSHLDRNKRRIIALSAVASELENSLSRWISNSHKATPAKTDYRSTRQLVGRLECSANRRFEIRYDLLDNAPLSFDENGENNTPYIPNPFPQYPPAGGLEKDKSSTKCLRPYLFWAAMNLAAPDETGKQHAVLISITQQIKGYAADFLQLLDKEWKEILKPPFFQLPSNPDKVKIWEKCLASCEDYFGVDSREYKLLKHGIVVHHGKMPGLMSRSLIEVVEERIVHLVIATSTLSEGINLPFETVLIPSLKRYRDGQNLSLNPSEFANLIGRAGRPGFGTEGRCLVLLNNQSQEWKVKQARNKYFSLIDNLEEQSKPEKGRENAKSPLSELLYFLKEKWSLISGSNSKSEFINWLEKTSPSNYSGTDTNLLSAIETLDSLDNIILSAIVEIEQLADRELNSDVLEERLQNIWQHSYAYYANQEISKFRAVYLSNVD